MEVSGPKMSLLYRCLPLMVILSLLAFSFYCTLNHVAGDEGSDGSREADTTDDVKDAGSAGLDRHPPGTWAVAHYDTAFKNRWGANLSVRAYYPAVGYNATFPLVCFCEGYMGFIEIIGEDKSWYYWLGENISSMGYVVIMFDFQGQGSSEIGPLLPERYHESDIELWPDLWPWIDDINDTITWAEDQHGTNTSSPIHGRVDTNRTSVVGHSTGGAQGLVASMLDPRIIAYLGYAPYDNNSQYWPPYPTDFLSERSIPVMIATGSEDLIVPPQVNGRIIFEEASKPKEYIVMEGKGHEPALWGRGTAKWYAEMWLNLFVKGDVAYFDELRVAKTGGMKIQSAFPSNLLPEIERDFNLPYDEGKLGASFIVEVRLSNSGYASLSNLSVELAVLEGPGNSTGMNESFRLGNLTGVQGGNSSSLRVNLTMDLGDPGEYVMEMYVRAGNAGDERVKFTYAVIRPPRVRETDYTWLVMAAVLTGSFILLSIVLMAVRRRMDRRRRTDRKEAIIVEVMDEGSSGDEALVSAADDE